MTTLTNFKTFSGVCIFHLVCVRGKLMPLIEKDLYEPSTIVSKDNNRQTCP